MNATKAIFAGTQGSNKSGVLNGLHPETAAHHPATYFSPIITLLVLIGQGKLPCLARSRLYQHFAAEGFIYAAKFFGVIEMIEAGNDFDVTLQPAAGQRWAEGLKGQDRRSGADFCQRNNSEALWAPL